MSELMTFSIEGLRFEKYEKSGSVNVYNEKTDEIVYMFTHDEIGSDYKKFRESCIESLNEEY